MVISFASQSNLTKKKKILLLAIIFSHFLPLVIAAFYDKALRVKCNIELSKPKFWLWFFMWWSAWTSLITIPWAIHKLFGRQKKSGFIQQLFDLIIVEANFLSGVIFCWGGFFLTKPRKPLILYPLVGQISTLKIWYFYNLFWHLLAPGLVFYYFWKYSSVDQLEKRKNLSWVVSFFNPALYILYNMARTHFSSYYPKLPPHQPYTYPPDYPYPPFFWINAKAANPSEAVIKSSGQKSWFYFWHSWPAWKQSLIWLTITLVFWYLVFGGLLWVLIKLKGKKILWPFFALTLWGFGFLLFLSNLK
ncbi:MAG: hypothetical protein I3273_03075 [Candidatus Moeniiplasma glomeromycotorum]|nr:hypothetical protein [Candidatus Moeniiplasma glomeromycotorum]MCE8167559.1 hypothetical protein [Candidatus Moeniiplasma glomeromycotorum]MCE8169089.1 hypothetical protein [Candidatus Moeniiplasma glomeromycotorum]